VARNQQDALLITRVDGQRDRHAREDNGVVKWD
jgi:hypothetical protein